MYWLYWNEWCGLFIDPEVHPQPEEYWGHVNPIGPRACYDEGKRVAETMCYAYAKQVMILRGFFASHFFREFCAQVKTHGQWLRNHLQNSVSAEWLGARNCFPLSFCLVVHWHNLSWFIFMRCLYLSFINFSTFVLFYQRRTNFHKYLFTESFCQDVPLKIQSATILLFKHLVDKMVLNYDGYLY